MSKYDNLLQQAKDKVEGLRTAIRSTAREIIPKMYHALKEENPRITPEDARDRIKRDCRCIWSNRTILEALPSEAKNPEKQKAGRLRQKGLNSAAFSAAGSGHNATQKIRKGGPGDFQIKECEGCLELLFENKDLKEALTKATVLTRAEEIVQHSSDGKESIFRFEFHIPIEDIKRHVATLNTDDCWFNVTTDTKIGKVIAATVGRSIELEAINSMC